MTALDISRRLNLGVFTLIFFTCFVIAGISLYYLSAIALDSFQTSNVFIGTLVSAMLLLVHSVWGCHRAKEVRAHTFSGRGKFATLIFFILTLVYLAAFITWTAETWDTNQAIVRIESKDLGYWYANPGSEERMLHNFANEFNSMWVAGDCSGNDCEATDCPGSCFTSSECTDPIALTPLVCTDKSMQSQFSNWVTHYAGTTDVFRTCVNLVFKIMDIPLFPTPTWCQSRTYLMDSAKDTNLVMFYFSLFQSIFIGLSIIAVVVHMKFIRQLGKTDQMTGADWLIYRSQLDASRWFSEDTNSDARKTPSPLS